MITGTRKQTRSPTRSSFNGSFQCCWGSVSNFARLPNHFSFQSTAAASIGVKRGRRPAGAAHAPSQRGSTDHACPRNIPFLHARLQHSAYLHRNSVRWVFLVNKPANSKRRRLAPASLPPQNAAAVATRRRRPPPRRGSREHVWPKHAYHRNELAAGAQTFSRL